MIYHIAKFLQAAGLTIILIAFITKFPELMSHNTLLAGMIIFAAGWIIQKFMLK